MGIHIKGIVKGQALSLTQEMIVGGSHNYLTAEFQLSPEWDGLHIVAMFVKDNQWLKIPLTEGRIDASQGLDLSAGVWECNLIGKSDDGMTVTTEIGTVTVGRTGSSAGDPFSITPTMADKIMSELGEFHSRLKKI